MKCSGCDTDVPKKHNASGRLYQPRVCSEECRIRVAVTAGRKGGKVAAPKCPLHIESRIDRGEV